MQLASRYFADRRTDAGAAKQGVIYVLPSDGSLNDMASYARTRDAAKTIAARELHADNPEAGTVAIEGK